MLESFNTQLANDPMYGKIIRELQGLTISVVAGAVAGTKMNIPAMRPEDTILAVIVPSATVPADDKANCTIQALKSSGTLTFAAAVNNDSFVVDGVTYTVKAAPTAPTHILLGGTDAQMAAKAVTAINNYNARYVGGVGSSNGYNNPSVYAEATGAVVTITAIAEGAGSAPVVASSGATLAVAGSGTTSATVTAATAVADNTVTINGVVFTVKAVPVNLDTQITLRGTDTAQATELTRAINAYQEKYSTLNVVATSVGAVVTIVPKVAAGGNSIVLTGTAVRLAASGAGTLAGGGSTGGFKSTTDLSGKNVVVHWFNKR